MNRMMRNWREGKRLAPEKVSKSWTEEVGGRKNSYVSLRQCRQSRKGILVGKQ